MRPAKLISSTVEPIEVQKPEKSKLAALLDEMEDDDELDGFPIFNSPEGMHVL
jgi:hypothetical protein